MKVALSIQNSALGSYCLAFLTQANHWRAFKCRQMPRTAQLPKTKVTFIENKVYALICCYLCSMTKCIY